MSYLSDPKTFPERAVNAGAMPAGFQLDLLRLNLGLARQMPLTSAPEAEAHERAVVAIQELERCL